MSSPPFPMMLVMILSREEALFSFERKVKVKQKSHITKTRGHAEMTLLI